MKKLIAPLIGLISCVTVSGGIVIPVGIKASSYYANGLSDIRDATQLVNGSGLSGEGPVLAQKHSQNTDTVAGGGMWLSLGTQTAKITFDLGVARTINQIFIWNYAEVTYKFGGAVNIDATYRGVKNMTVLADNSPNPTTLLGAFTLAKTVQVNSISYNAQYQQGDDFTAPVQTITFASPVTARYFTFSITSNHRTLSTQDDYTGLSEVRFGTAP